MMHKAVLIKGREKPSDPEGPVARERASLATRRLLLALCGVRSAGVFSAQWRQETQMLCVWGELSSPLLLLGACSA